MIKLKHLLLEHAISLFCLLLQKILYENMNFFSKSMEGKMQNKVEKEITSLKENF